MKNQSNEEIYIYVLALQSGKYYVGQSNDVNRRFKEHLSSSRGSGWTRLYRPESILKRFRTGTNNPDIALKFENDITFSCIKEYGWQNVRGGDFTQIDDNDHHLALILKSPLCQEICPVETQAGTKLIKNRGCIFTLELEEGNYFVGTTKNINLAILSELNGFGAEWTKLYRPVKIVKVTYHNFNNYTIGSEHLNELKIAFLNYHYSKVRGGIFSRVHPKSHQEMVYELMGIKCKL